MEMTDSDVTNFYLQMAALGIEVWLDGGWGVDALLGEQSRSHADLDIIVQESDLGSVREELERQGFREVERNDSRPWNFVLGDGRGKEIDLHIVVLDLAGNGIYGPPENGEMYPAEALQGKGAIGGIPVRCTSPEFQIHSHTGYDIGETDYKDVQALAKKFGIELPQDYKERFG